MRFYSGQRRDVSLKEVLFRGFAPDGGLYLPQELPTFHLDELNGPSAICDRVASKLFPEVPGLHACLERAFNFPIPLVPLSDQITALELFHGPTLSFKDFGARLLAELIDALKEPHEELTVLVATSGDTGSAVGRAFYDRPGVRVFILYPKGAVTPSQEQQITTIGKNVTAVEIEGGFEACQELVKQACLDRVLPNTTTGNSINIVRLLAHTLYYFYAYSQLKQSLTISVPCGNFGHLVAGILAKRMGLPISRFVAATNINDEVPLFLKSGVFKPHPSYHTIAVSMDVGNPSNFPRLLELYDHSLEKMRTDLIGVSFTDGEIASAIKELHEATGYLLDPHSAVAYLGLKNYLALNRAADPGLFFATAHPAKFRESIEPILQQKIPLPHSLQISKSKEVLSCSCNYGAFKALLL